MNLAQHLLDYLAYQALRTESQLRRRLIAAGADPEQAREWSSLAAPPPDAPLDRTTEDYAAYLIGAGELRALSLTAAYVDELIDDAQAAQYAELETRRAQLLTAPPDGKTLAAGG